MYGIVNKFISHTVVNRYGQHHWDSIKAMVDFEAEDFVEMQPYSDDVTFGIVGAAIEELNLDANQFLEELGHDWVVATAEGSYKSMYTLVSGGMFEFIQNLNNMHQVISAQLTELIPPTFLCERDEEGNIIVKYFSERAGLDAFVKGLLMGLCSHFNEPGSVELISSRDEQQPFSVFKINHQ